MKIRRVTDEPEIPTTSMADIAFLLIVFFMLTSVFAETRGINFAIPPKDDEEEKSDEREEAVAINIDAQGRIRIDSPAISRDDMYRELRGYLRPKLIRWPEKPILVTAEEDSPYGVFVEVYDALRGVEKDFRSDPAVPVRNLKLSILSLNEIRRLKEQFGEDIFG